MAAGPIPTYPDICWDAPAPFTGLIGTSFKVDMDSPGQVDRMDKVLRSLRLIGYTSGSSEAKFPPHRNLIETLNAYNMRRLNRLNRSWAWVEEKVLQIPSYTLDITNDATWDPSSTKPNDTHDIYHDFAHPWPALSTWPDRDASTSPGSPKYRLAIFIHVHPTISARGTVQKSQGVYSVSIWDRENNELCWHDPWPHDRTPRRQNIQRYWRDCQSDWRNDNNPDFNDILQFKNDYNALAHLQGCSYRVMEPRFSYWAVIGIILWCMNNIDNPGLLRPPDTEEVLSGMATDLLPSLYVNTFMTMNENCFKFYWPEGGAIAQEVMDEYREYFEDEYQLGNRYFAQEVSRLFDPLRASNNGPVPDWLVTAVIGN